MLSRIALGGDELVVDIGAGRGSLTLPLARAGARVLAIERDRAFVRELQASIEREGMAGRVRLRRGDLRDAPLPREPYRVVASPPFALTTRLLARLLDDVERGPTRADLLVQWEVARKLSHAPPRTLRAAAWAPWWSFSLGEKVPRRAFKPAPSVDAGWLTIVRRDPPVLPVGLADGFADVLRSTWDHRAR